MKSKYSTHEITSRGRFKVILTNEGRKYLKAWINRTKYPDFQPTVINTLERIIGFKKGTITVGTDSGHLFDGEIFKFKNKLYFDNDYAIRNPLITLLERGSVEFWNYSEN